MFFAPPSRVSRTAPRARPAAPEVGADADEPVRGCGWFDSSHELRCGLLVTEHAAADAVANGLPFADWPLHLGGWRAPQFGR